MPQRLIAQRQFIYRRHWETSVKSIRVYFYADFLLCEGFQFIGNKLRIQDIFDIAAHKTGIIVSDLLGHAQITPQTFYSERFDKSVFPCCSKYDLKDPFKLFL